MPVYTFKDLTTGQEYDKVMSQEVERVGVCVGDVLNTEEDACVDCCVGASVGAQVGGIGA